MALPRRTSTEEDTGRPILTLDGLVAEPAFVESPADRRWPPVTLVLMLLAIVVVLGAIGRSVRESAAPVGPTERSEAIAEPDEIEVQPEDQPSNWMSTWPDPPDDHAPIVIGTPAINEPLADELPGHTLVYVNSIDRPTVIDLVRGGRQELSISAVRQRDRFLVEDGRVVDNDPLNPDLPMAGSRAIAIFVHRRALTETVDLSESLPYDGPHLCLDPSGCDGAWRYSSSLLSGDQRVTRVAVDSDSALEQIFDPAAVDAGGRFLLVVGPSGAEVKVPIPRVGSPVWLIADVDGSRAS